MVYLSRHSSGIDAFKSEAEKTQEYQKELQLRHKLQKQVEQSNMGDLFSEEPIDQVTDMESMNSLIYHAKQSILKLLENGPVMVDMNVWAHLLEPNVCLPSHFQIAVKELLMNKLIRNVSSDVTRRTSKPLIPKNGELWELSDGR